MSEAKDLMVALTARTPFEAEAVALVLREEGIPVYIAGDLLQDEFAAARRVVGVQVQVPREFLARAHAAIAAAKAAGRHIDEEPPEEDAQ